MNGTRIEAASGQRFTLVDALRGIAAVGVLFHHMLFNSELQVTLWSTLPFWLLELCRKGAFGVEIFFVLSGFVIVHSLRNVRMTPRAVGNFMLRRQLRLDPPYWTMLVLTVASIYVEQHVPWIERRPLPTWYEFGANLFYLNQIVGSVQIMAVSWTLCMEVQFYLVLILLLLAGKTMSPSGARSATYSAALVWVLGITSMLLPRYMIPGWFIELWFYFAAGALCYWAVHTPRFRMAFLGYMGLFLVAAIWQEPRPMLMGWTTALLLYTAGRMGKLSTWLNFAPLQYFGRISYSLYLSHLMVAAYVLRLGYRLTGTNHAGAALWFCVAGVVSIAAAHALYLLVERPSIRLAARFKPAREGEPAPALAAPKPALEGAVEEQMQNA